MNEKNRKEEILKKEFDKCMSIFDHIDRDNFTFHTLIVADRCEDAIKFDKDASKAYPDLIKRLKISAAIMEDVSDNYSSYVALYDTLKNRISDLENLLIHKNTLG